MEDPAQSGEVPGLSPAEARETAVYERLSALGIAWRTHPHAPVFTVQEAQVLRGSLPGRDKEPKITAEPDWL